MKPGVALVTGAGGRLGRAMAVALGEDGWSVLIHYRTSVEGARETAEAVRLKGAKAEIVHADLSCEEGRCGLVERAAGLMGRPVTMLVNSASTFLRDTAHDHDRSDWDVHMEANFRAPVHLAQQFASQIGQSGEGLIVNLTDQRVLKPDPRFFTYTLSKSALWQATCVMAQAFAPMIRVNAIGPGPTLRSVHQSVAEFAAEQAATLTGRGSDPDEIVHALRYLRDAHSVTGQMICPDGGQHLLWQTPDTFV